MGAVVIEGHTMVLDDDNPLKRFLLTAYNAHCPFCLPSGFALLSVSRRRIPCMVNTLSATRKGCSAWTATIDKGRGAAHQLDKAVPA
jgi:hypothetical protein